MQGFLIYKVIAQLIENQGLSNINKLWKQFITWHVYHNSSNWKKNKCKKYKVMEEKTPNL